MTAYYNENDPKAAATLRELVKRNVIAPGDVDERSIEDVRPDDLRKYTQCHFFAGAGVWSYSLRLAHWPDERPVWTGSCPCQPFSAAGKGAGFTDERHLWPAWFHLIEHAKARGIPVFGEQVASRDGLAWLDLVQTDLEGEGYTVRSFDLCAAGFGAPHTRQRLYFVADCASPRSFPVTYGGIHSREESTRPRHGELERHGATVELAHHHHHHQRLEGRNGESEGGEEFITGSGGMADRMANNNNTPRSRFREHSGEILPEQKTERLGAGGAVGFVDLSECERELRSDRNSIEQESETQIRREENTRFDEARNASADDELDDTISNGRRTFGDDHGSDDGQQPYPANPHDGADTLDNFWRDTDWLLCRDGKWRPVEPGTFPLADGAAQRVGRLRLYGNAIVAPQAAEFIKAYKYVNEGFDLI